MPRVRFLKDFRWAIQAVNGTVAVNYIAGMRELVTTPCAEAAFAAGAAVPWEPVNNDPPPPYEEAPQPHPTVYAMPPSTETPSEPTTPPIPPPAPPPEPTPQPQPTHEPESAKVASSSGRSGGSGDERKSRAGR